MSKKKKPERRQNGEGSIRERDDGRLEFRYTIKNPITGKSERKSLVKNKEQQEEFYDEVYKIQERIRKGRILDPSKITLWDWVYKWLHSYKKTNVEETTFDSYEIEAEAHIKDSFIAKKILKNLQTDDLQNYYNELIKDLDKKVLKCDKCGYEITDMQEIDRLKQSVARYRHCPKCFLGRLKIIKGISIRTIHYLRTQIIGAALEKARTCTPPLIDSNPNEGTEIPALIYKKTKPFSREQALYFLKSCENDKHFPAICTDMSTGLRIGELLSLKWVNVNLDKQYVKIVESVKKVRNRNKKDTDDKKWVLKDGKPKTNASIRIVPLSNRVTKVLRKHQKEQEFKKRVLGETKYKDRGLVFCNDDGTQISPDNFRKHYKILLKHAGIPENKFHALRHTVGALLLEDGEDLKVIQDLLGHENIDTTADIYVEVTDKLRRRTASKIDSILSDDSDNRLEDAKDEG